MSNDLSSSVFAKKHWLVDRDTGGFHPLASTQFLMLMNRMNELADMKITKTRLTFFEGFRTPYRQQSLLESKVNGKSVTKAGKYQSAHQMGLAVDFAARDEKGFHWNVPSADWLLLQAEAQKLGLRVPLAANDPGHIEHPLWQHWRHVEGAWPPPKVVRDQDDLLDFS